MAAWAMKSPSASKSLGAHLNGGLGAEVEAVVEVVEAGPHMEDDTVR